MMTNNTNTNNATVNASKLEFAKAQFAKALGFIYKESGCRMVVRKVQIAMLVASKSGNLSEATVAVDEAMKEVPVEGLPEYVIKAWPALKGVVVGVVDTLKAAGSKALECCPEFVRMIFSDLGTLLGAVIQGLKVVWDAAKGIIKLIGTGALRLAAMCLNTLKKFFNWLKGKGFDLLGGIKSKLRKWSDSDLEDAVGDLEDEFENYDGKAEEFDPSSCFPQG